MKFSRAVLHRANALKNAYSQLFPGTDTLHSISFVDTAWEMWSDMQIDAPEKADKWLDIATEQEGKLRKRGILNDSEAIAYMDRVEPIFKQYLIQYKAMLERHQDEIDRMLHDFRP